MSTQLSAGLLEKLEGRRKRRVGMGGWGGVGVESQISFFLVPQKRNFYFHFEGNGSFLLFIFYHKNLQNSRKIE